MIANTAPGTPKVSEAGSPGTAVGEVETYSPLPPAGVRRG